MWPYQGKIQKQVAMIPIENNRLHQCVKRKRSVEMRRKDNFFLERSSTQFIFKYLALAHWYLHNNIVRSTLIQCLLLVAILLLIDVSLTRYQTSKKEFFAKIINAWNSLTIFGKCSISGVWQVSEYTSVTVLCISVQESLFHLYHLAVVFLEMWLKIWKFKFFSCFVHEKKSKKKK